MDNILSCTRMPTILSNFDINIKSSKTYNSLGYGLSGFEDIIEDARDKDFHELVPLAEAIYEHEKKFKDCSVAVFETRFQRLEKGDGLGRVANWHLDRDAYHKIKRIYMYSSCLSSQCLLNEVSSAQYKIINGYYSDDIDELKEPRIYSPSEGDLMCIDGLTIHRAPKVDVDCLRTFVRAIVL